MVESKKKYLTEELVAAFVEALSAGRDPHCNRKRAVAGRDFLGRILTTIFSIIIVNYA